MATNGTVPVIDPVRAAESNLPRILGVTTTVHAIALIFVSLRMYARLVVVKSAGKDDICMGISAVRISLSLSHALQQDLGGVSPLKSTN